MSVKLKASRLAVVLTALLAASAPAQSHDLSTEQISRLKAGDALVAVNADDGEADGHIEAAIDIAAPPARVFAIMLDCNHAMKFLSNLKSCKILEVSPDGLTDLREHRSKWLSILPETVSVFRSTYVKDREIRFEKVRGDFRFLKGSWQLEPIQNGAATRVFYDVRVGINAPVPGFMIRGALEQDVPKVLKGLRDEVTKKGP